MCVGCVCVCDHLFFYKMIATSLQERNTQAVIGFLYMSYKHENPWFFLIFIVRRVISFCCCCCLCGSCFCCYRCSCRCCIVIPTNKKLLGFCCEESDHFCCCIVAVIAIVVVHCIVVNAAAVADLSCSCCKTIFDKFLLDIRLHCNVRKYTVDAHWNIDCYVVVFGWARVCQTFR